MDHEGTGPLAPHAHRLAWEWQRQVLLHSFTLPVSNLWSQALFNTFFGYAPDINFWGVLLAFSPLWAVREAGSAWFARSRCGDVVTACHSCIPRSAVTLWTRVNFCDRLCFNHNITSNQTCSWAKDINILLHCVWNQNSPREYVNWMHFAHLNCFVYTVSSWK